MFRLKRIVVAFIKHQFSVCHKPLHCYWIITCFYSLGKFLEVSLEELTVVLLLTQQLECPRRVLRIGSAADILSARLRFEGAVGEKKEAVVDIDSTEKFLYASR